MLNVVAALRRANHARLARRRDTPPGWLTRLVRRIKARNRDRLARRRAQRQLLASLVANDTAVLEALVFLLQTAREEQRERTEIRTVLLERLSALERRLAGGERAAAAPANGSGNGAKAEEEPAPPRPAAGRSGPATLIAGGSSGEHAGVASVTKHT